MRIILLNFCQGPRLNPWIRLLTRQRSLAAIHKPADSSVVPSQQNSQVLSNILTMWHYRLGHPATSIVGNIIMSNSHVPNRNKMELPFCSARSLGKIQKFAFLLHLTNILLFISSHRLVGSLTYPSSNGYRYYMHFTDDYTKFMWLYLLRNKSEGFQTYCNFKT